MPIPKQEVPRTEWPRALLYGAGITCGVLAAMAVQIVLSRMGIELAGVWRDLFSSRALQLRSAGAWWLIAGSALVVSALVSAILHRLPLPWHRFRALRWLLGAGIVLALAEIGHSASLIRAAAPSAPTSAPAWPCFASPP